MRRISKGLLTSAMVMAVFATTPALAADYSAGKAVDSAEAARSLGGKEFTARQAKPVPSLKGGISTSRSAAVLDPEAAKKAFTVIGRTHDGKDVRMEPGEKVLRAISGEAKPEQRGALDPATTIDPEAGEDSTARAVVGADNRIKVSKTTTYPYTTIGYLELKNSAGEYLSCSAALIGPSTILTAGNCLYNHSQEGGWFDDFTFWPAVNGENDVPYGGFEYDTAYVFEGFITNYDGSYDSVWPYDIGLITLQQPVGDSLGWLGYWDYENLGDFQGNLVGYHNDKPAFTMWRSTCGVLAEEVYDNYFLHGCDFDVGGMGAPIYLYDSDAKSRVVVGVNIDGTEEANWALRLDGPIMEWIQEINK
jgi:V8-like Glu-specific endopeptidase